MKFLNNYRPASAIKCINRIVPRGPDGKPDWDEARHEVVFDDGERIGVPIGAINDLQTTVIPAGLGWWQAEQLFDACCVFAGVHLAPVVAWQVTEDGYFVGATTIGSLDNFGEGLTNNPEVALYHEPTGRIWRWKPTAPEAHHFRPVMSHGLDALEAAWRAEDAAERAAMDEILGD
jgi:hypothetical protein